MSQQFIDQKQFSGRLNSDDSQLVIGQTDHAMAFNGRFRGSGNNLRFENTPGTILITNDYLPVGNNFAIGSFYDPIGQRVIWFNSNSNNRHGIYMYSVVTGLITRLLQCFVNSTTDILGFSPNFPIPSVNIIYTTDEDGDLLCWTDRNKRPKILNIQDAIDNIYGSNWLEEYLDVAKAPPAIPPYCAYENDGANTINNMRKLLFQGMYRFIYDDNLKSVWSSYGEMPIAFSYNNPQIDNDTARNCRIGFIIQTGPASVRKLEIAVRQQSETEDEGNVWGDPFSVIVLDKDELNIPDNDTYIFRFYNNEAYVPIDIKEFQLYFDYVPDKANTQELLNGNVIVYGAITEGLNPVVPIVTVTPSFEKATATNLYAAFLVTQQGKQGFSTGNIRFSLIGNALQKNIYSATVDVSGTPFTITYTAAANDTTALVLAGLSTSATGQGFTQVSISANELVISRTNQVLLKSRAQGVNQTIAGTFALDSALSKITIALQPQWILYFPKDTLFYVFNPANTSNTRQFITQSSSVVGSNLEIIVDRVPVSETVVGTLTFVPPVNFSVPAFDWNMKENLALAYFDEKGKSCGAITSTTFNGTSGFGGSVNLNTVYWDIPTFSLSISHRPPLDAKYYHILRSGNLTKLRYLYLMSDRTYKDNVYAYISIESLQIYKEANPRSILGYGFTPGDRISFKISYAADSSPAGIFFDRDYEIYDTIVNPEINGLIQNGQFVRILLPTTSVFFDFGNFLTRTWYFYQIELYTPAKSAGVNLDTYKEFVQRYEIGNPGTSTRFHQGMIQNQSTDLVTPATFLLDKGDAFFRNRKMSCGNTLTYDFKPYAAADLDFVPALDLKKNSFDGSPYRYAQTVPEYTGGTSFNTPSWVIETADIDCTFNLKGIVNFRVNDNNLFTIRLNVNIYSNAGAVTNVILFSDGGAGGGQGFYKVIPPTTITIPAHSRAYLIFVSPLAQVHSLDIIGGNITFEEQKVNFIIGCMDQNFSDFYESKVNSNGRAWVVNPDEKTIEFDTLVRWGLAFQQNTNINQINRFYPFNFDEVDRAKGAIQRFKTRDRILKVFQNRGVGRYQVYSKFVQSGDANILTTTDEILVKNNIDYYKGAFGMGDQYCSLVSGKNQDYFIDTVRGYQLRSAEDGLTPISEINKGQFFIQPLFIPYNQEYLRPNNSIARIMGAYDFLEEEAISVLPSGSLIGKSINAYTFSFNEKRNSYCSFYDFKNMDWIGNVEDKIALWKNGNFYLLTNTNKCGNFFDEQFSSSITLVFNKTVSLTQTFLAGGYQANQEWTAEQIGDVITSQPNAQTNLIQQSAIKDWNLTQQEGKYHFHLNRDCNSMDNPLEALNEGDELKGVFIQVKFSYKGSEFSFLYLPYIKSVLSQQNY